MNTTTSIKIRFLALLLPFVFAAGCNTLQQSASEASPVIKDEVILLDVDNRTTSVIELPSELRDLSAYTGVSAHLENTGSSKCRVEAYMNDQRWINSCVYLQPGESKTIEVLFKRNPERGTRDFPNMDGLPGGTLFHLFFQDPSESEKITFMVFTKEKASVKITGVSPFGEFVSPEEIAANEDFFPFIDAYGQYKHADWPGKVKSDQEFLNAAQKENERFPSIPPAEERNQYGGWKNGPKLKATGHFRVEKVEGKWWFVDPEGCLFWSHGVDCVRFGNASTRVTGRRHFYEGLPRENDPLYAFMNFRDPLYPFVKDATFNYTAANLFRKYGEDWEEMATIDVLRRIKNFGFTSFGNWADPKIYLYDENRSPYPASIGSGGPRLDGKNKKFPDVFDPAFRKSLANNLLANATKQKDDPYCIGFFIDNELWVDQLTRYAMIQPSGGYAKKALMAFLKDRYGSISKVNRKWETIYTSWDQLAEESTLPDLAEDDCKDFDLVIVDRYYCICREEFDKHIPNKLYMGSRLHCHYYPDDQSELGIIKIAARYCDVVSFNRYRFSAEDLILPEGIDKPIIIGEFHFGALDRGHFHTGLRSVANQEQRAECYYNYVLGALDNPQIVGTHWFQYSDQAFTGRGDGENYQIGFVDICDNPYPEIVDAAREIGTQLYQLRAKPE